MSDAVRLLASLILLLSLSAATPLLAQAKKAAPPAKKAKQSQAQPAQPAEADAALEVEEEQQVEAEPADEELAPAAVTLDVSKDSPLIQVLYQATRETKEQAILDRIAQAQKLVEGGADLKALDPQAARRCIGRCLVRATRPRARHWSPTRSWPTP